MKVVINNKYGGFGLSDEAIEWMVDKYNLTIGETSEGRENLIVRTGGTFSKYYIWTEDSPEFRTNPMLIDVVETLGEKANGDFAKLKIIEIPDDVKWQIEDYDGVEWIAEVHRTWN